MSRQTPFDTGARYEAKPWYPDRSDPDTYGKVDFEDDAGETALTVYAGQEDGKVVVHLYAHGLDEYAIEIDDRDVRFELPELTREEQTGLPAVDQVQGIKLLGDLAPIFREMRSHGWTRASVEYVMNQVWWEDVQEAGRRREALLALREHTLPSGAPGAWTRDAIDRELGSSDG